MTILSRLPSARASLRRFGSRSALALCSVALCTAGLLTISAPAGAVVQTVGVQAFGLSPRDVESPWAQEGIAPATFANAAGNPVVHSSAVYAVYWDPTDHYHGDWQHVIDGFFENFSASSGAFTSIFSVDSQYTDRTNQHAAYSSAFRGAYTDTNPYPVAGCTDPHPLLAGDAIVCLTDQQVREELGTFIAQHSMQKGMSSIFYLLTPPGVTVCLDAAGVHCSDSVPLPAIDANSFCSYHAAISPTDPVSGDANTILYAVIPWSAGGAGDYHLFPGDRTFAYACQDGGFDPSSKPVAGEREQTKEMNVTELEAFEKESAEEKAATERRRALEGPHSEEPNQIGLGPDGSYDTGLADIIVGQIAQEQQNVVTDPLLNGWQDETKHEAADECRNDFVPVLGGAVTANELTEAGSLYNQTLGESNYYLNTAFNRAALELPYPGIPCLAGIRLEPEFSIPTGASAGDILGFDGMESDITLDGGTGFTPAGAPRPIYSTYTWDFGDGSAPVSGYAPGAPAANSPAVSPCQAPWEAPCAASAFHTYTYGGAYQVTLKVTDVGGNTASTMHTVTVIGPPPPPPATPSGGSPATAGAGATNGSNGPGNSSPTPGPVARAAASGHSLGQALRRGLLVNYSVNEQVAGHFEVLLESRVARRLGIKGRPAGGLPAGSPPSLIVGQALLITQTGGHSSVRIKFSKRTSERLHRVRKVTLLLRLVVRNADPQNPQSTTVLSPVTLHR